MCQAEEILPSSTSPHNFQLSNSRYENLATALAENTGPNSPDHEQLTSMFLLLHSSPWRLLLLYPFLVLTSNNV